MAQNNLVSLQNKGHSGVFKDNNTLTEKEQKYCSCVLKVGVKNPSTCNKSNWNTRSSGCYNPYAVCTKSVGTTSRKCGENYNFEKLPDDGISWYASTKNISIPVPYNREDLLHRIQEWKSGE